MSQKIIDSFRANYKGMSPESITNEVLRSNTYCVLSTATITGEPWVTPFRYRVDPDANLYWTSARDTRHSVLLSANHNVAAVVIDLRFIDSVSSAVYISGTAREVPYDELPELIHWRYPEGKRSLADFDPVGRHRAVYQLRPKSIWCLAEPDIINGAATDKRVIVDVEKLRQLTTGAQE